MKFNLTLLLFILLFTQDIISQKSPGYTLICTGMGTGSTSGKLIDTSGATYKSWSGFTAQTRYSSYMLPGGYLLRAAIASSVNFSGGPICGRVVKTDWNGNVVWDYTYSTTNYVTHHDICPMPNGNVLLISYERRTATETSAMGGSSSIEMWPDKIVEVKPTGATTADVVWEWRSWDHLQQNVNSAKPNYNSSLVPERLNINYKQSKDWLHMNGVDYNPLLDQVCFSSHFMNEIYVIDHSTTTAEAASSQGGRSGKGGDILYRFGNPAAYGGTGSATINVCHDAHWIDEGPFKNYLAYFNNNGISATQSSVDFVNPPLNANGFTYSKTGSQYGPSTYSKRYACNGYTSNEGGSQSFANGNLMYTIALSGNIYEVDSSGNLKGSWSAGGGMSKAKRYTSCELSGGLVVTCSPYNYDLCGAPSSPIALSCTGTGSGTMSYKWSSYPSGFTSTLQNPTVTPTVSTTYICEVSNGSCTASNYIVVNIRPKATVNAGNDTSITTGMQATLRATATNATSYKWSNGATQPVITVSPLVTTSYRVVVTSEGGCSDSDDVIVTVAGGPLSVSAMATNLILCEGTSTDIIALASGGSGTYTYAWTSVPAGFVSTAQNPLVTPLVTTKYTVDVNDGTGNASSYCIVNVNPTPTRPSVSLSGKTFTSTLAASYQWYRDGVIIPGATSQVYITTIGGNYSVKIKDSNGCESAVSDPVAFTGINYFSNLSKIKIYPNPVTSILNIEGEGAFQITGQEILNTTSKIIDLSSFEAGTYFIKVYADNNLVAVRNIILMK